MSNLAAYKIMRVFLRETNLQLFNLIFCNRLMRSSFFLSCSPGLYRMASFIPGRNITNKMMAATLGKAYSGAMDHEQLKNTLENYGKISINPYSHRYPCNITILSIQSNTATTTIAQTIIKCHQLPSFM